MTVDFVLLTAGVVILCAGVFTTLNEGGLLSSGIEAMLGAVTDKAAEVQFPGE